MKIKKITLFTNQLLRQKAFYVDVLGFELLAEYQTEFTIQVGFSQLTFQQSQWDKPYHFCFLIPSNKLAESIEWLKTKTELVKIEGDRVIQRFETWNADSVYFFDGGGNLAEFIVRYDLQNEEQDDFDISQVLCVNEIGMPNSNIEKTNSMLEQQLNSKLWKGNLERFAVNGTQTGLFLLVNNQLKKEWFPTNVSTSASPFTATVEVDGKEYDLAFFDGELKIN